MKKRYILVTILLIFFLFITVLVQTNNIKVFDDNIYNFLISFRCSQLDTFFKVITKLGNVTTILCIVIILMIILNKKEGIILGVSTVNTVLINQIIKYIIRRARPDHLRLIKQGGYSFPSGHAMIAIAVYGFLIYLVYKKISNKKIKIPLIILLTIIIISIGLSRIYVGVHYPSDILGGYVISLAILILNITLCSKYLRGNKYDKDGCK